VLELHGFPRELWSASSTAVLSDPGLIFDFPGGLVHGLAGTSELIRNAQWNTPPTT
jgi:hypothetical protein